jgi:hypothetical protein
MVQVQVVMAVRVAQVLLGLAVLVDSLAVLAVAVAKVLLLELQVLVVLVEQEQQVWFQSRFGMGN